MVPAAKERKIHKKNQMNTPRPRASDGLRGDPEEPLGGLLEEPPLTQISTDLLKARSPSLDLESSIAEPTTSTQNRAHPTIPT